jgi:transcriptional regulator with XRE-family HTH domain
LAGRIRGFRARRSMTQRDLADRLGVTQQTVARWEQGSPPSRAMLRMIDALLEESGGIEPPTALAPIIGIHPPAEPVRSRSTDEARKVYVQGCLKLLERGERLPNRVLLVLADELGWPEDDD